ncbi:TPA: hypothetical protein ACSPZX_003409 [Aeromonas veronii]
MKNYWADSFSFSPQVFFIFGGGLQLSEKLCIFDGSRHPEWPFLPQFNTSEHLIAAR